jgi:hypothetical protein
MHCERLTGKQHFRRPRRQRNSRLSFLSRCFCRKKSRSSSQTGRAGFKTTQSRRPASAEVIEERFPHQDDSGRHYDLFRRRARFGRGLQSGRKQLYPEARRLRSIPRDRKITGPVLAGGQQISRDRSRSGMIEAGPLSIPASERNL